MWLIKIRRHVSYPNVVMTLALVFAMAGGAWAAAGSQSRAKRHKKSLYVVTSTKQIAPAVLKALKGRPGAPGAAGPAGAPGTPGLTGPIGKDGAPGTSVTARAVSLEEAACSKLGGGEFKVGSGAPVFACNGETGFTEHLPAGKTETGDWVIEANLSSTGFTSGSAFTSVSFSIPMATAPETVYVKAGETKAGCTGNVEEPGAEPGHLCVFAQTFEHNVLSTNICSVSKGSLGVFSCASGETGNTADPTGALIAAVAENPGLMALSGTWAVTA